MAFPLVEIPVAHLLLLHCVGLEASAVEVAAFPVVLLEIVAGRSVADKPRKVGVAAGPEAGPRQNRIGRLSDELRRKRST